MKYLVAASEPKLEAKVSKRFGHSEYFMVVDSETLSFEAIKGVGHDQPRHGVGQFSKFNIERLIVGNIGPGAFVNVKDMGWAVFSCIGLTVNEAIAKVHYGEVSELTAPTMKQSVHSAGGPGHGDGRSRK
jgi:predicted Fe-Mo cluster-binding NifX family protein